MQIIRKEEITEVNKREIVHVDTQQCRFHCLVFNFILYIIYLHTCVHQCVTNYMYVPGSKKKYENENLR
jgi:hypothetical protein